jgi:predicted nucleic acid-binding protein
MLLYLDTSVFGGHFEPEFEEWTVPLFRLLEQGKHRLLFSDIIETELIEAPIRVRRLAMESRSRNAIEIVTDQAALDLAARYLKEKVVGKTSFNDCRHIALATLHNADVLVSWNFKHIVNVERILGYNAVNTRLGHRILDIRSPREIIGL